VSRLNDISLATQVAVFGNKRAFDQLVRQYQGSVRRFLLSQTMGNEALSDDLAQDTFLKAYTHMAQYRGAASFQTWLMRIAYNIFYDHKRKTLRSAPDGQQPPDKAETPQPHLHMDLYQALSLLRDEERTCITLQYIDGQPIEQISLITGIPVNTVKSHLKRGKEKLTTYLKQNGYDHTPR
jgi:RNA polymerase sigma-70 factor (ECF subfamily)